MAEAEPLHKLLPCERNCITRALFPKLFIVLQFVQRGKNIAKATNCVQEEYDIVFHLKQNTPPLSLSTWTFFRPIQNALCKRTSFIDIIEDAAIGFFLNTLVSFLLGNKIMTWIAEVAF